jgi:hypothetical protein
MIDLLRDAAALPDHPRSLWPDLRTEMRQLADSRANDLLLRMQAALQTL